MDQQHQPHALMRCSLRQEDEPFVDLVIAITRWRQENRNDLLNLARVILATSGTATIIDSIFGDKSKQ